MPNFDIDKQYSEQLEQLTTKTKVHANVVNPILGKLINNDAHLNEQIGSLSVFVTPQMKGAKGDGILDSSNNYVSGTNDTAAIQSAFNDGRTVVIPDGVYMVDAVTKLTVPSNRHIIFSANAKFKVIPNSSDNYRVLDVYASNNVVIENPTLIGDRNEHIGSVGDGGQGHGIVTSSASNITILNPTCKNFWGDGITIYGITTGVIDNPVIDNCKRQGISIVRCQDLTINNPIITNINGFSPQSGIDIEPNANTDYIKNLRIVNMTTKNCAGQGIMLVLANLAGTSQEISIDIINHKDYGSSSGFFLGGFVPTVQMTGKIVLKEPYYTDNDGNGITIQDYQSQYSPLLHIINPTIINPNVINTTFAQYGSGIVLSRETNYPGTAKMGHIVIDEPIIRDTRTTPLMLRGIYFYDAKSVGCDSVIIRNPLEISGVVQDYKIATQTPNITTGIKVVDTAKVLTLDTTTQFSAIYNYALTKFTNTSAPQVSQMNLNTSTYLDMPIEFVNTTTFGMIIVPPAGMNIVPLSTVNGKYINTTQVGASIRLRRLNSTSFIAENMNGTWSVQP